MAVEFVNAAAAYNRVNSIKPEISQVSNFSEAEQNFNKVLNNVNIAFNSPISNLQAHSAASQPSAAVLALNEFNDNLRTKLKKAEKISAQAAKGEANLSDLVTNLSEARLTLQEVSLVSKKLLAAWHEMISISV